MDVDKYEFQIGAFECTLFKDYLFTYDAGSFFSNVDPNELALALNDRNSDAKKILSPFVSLLVEKGEQRILIDTGVGSPSEPLQFQGHAVNFDGRLHRLLADADIDPASIAHLILTHFHPDHIGGNCDENGSPAFSNAIHWTHQREHDFWKSSQAQELPALFRYYIDTNILPLDQVDFRLIDTKEAEIVPGIHTIHTPGHTPGHLAVLIESDGEHLLFISDTWLHPLHIAHLDWRTVHDMDHETAWNSRKQMLELASDEKMLVQSFHFEFPGLGWVERDGTGWRWLTKT